MTEKKRGVLDAIPANLLDDYLNWRLSSRELAEKTGYHRVYLRRAIKRPARTDTLAAAEAQKKILLAMRQEFWRSIAHRSIKEIMAEACVSETTAHRIRKKYNAKTPV